MNESNKKIEGYVYILEVKDIDLPVCKIGMTSRHPEQRCAEINNSSTGDFIWEVAHHVAVDDCQKLESLVHQKLKPLKQKRREFFNIPADTAYDALISIIDNQTEIKRITIEISKLQEKEVVEKPKRNAKREQTFRKIDLEYTELLQSFAELIGVKGRPFGQLNKPVFGMSDGKEGVQWNLAIFTDNEEIQLGVNLEGMKYLNWPIATFLLSELSNPSIEKLKAELEHPELIFIHFVRDAWQVTSRPDIVERYFGGGEIPLSDMNVELWTSILTKALTCLNADKAYRGRNKQTVTLANIPKNGEQVRMMEVSPHLTIWTPIDLSGDITTNLENGISLLKPVHEWIDRR